MKNFIVSIPYNVPLDKFVEKLDEFIDPHEHTNGNALRLPVAYNDIGVNLFFSIFKCERCGRCCISPDPITPENNFIAYLPSEYEYAKKCLSKDIIKNHFQPKEFGYKCYYPCPFYTSSGCSIYKHRPKVCSTYPIDPLTNESEYLIVDISCPGALKATKLIYIVDYCNRNHIIDDIVKQKLEA